MRSGASAPPLPPMNALHLLNILAAIEAAKGTEREAVLPPRKRGRPKGSKNKPKVSHGDIR